MNVGLLEKRDIRIIRLRLAYDVYAATQPYLTPLFDSDVNPDGVGFVDVMRQIAVECVERISMGQVREPAAYHAQIRAAFALIASRFAADPKYGEFVSLLEQMRDSVRPLSAEECAGGLQNMMMEGWQFFQDMMSELGGSLSSGRSNAMVESGPATMQVRKGEREFTYCHYLEERHEIHLNAGERTDLFALFDLPFYFLHEYVSHAFALWDDSRWRFSEAYLLCCARRYLNGRWFRHDRQRRYFLGRNLDALRVRCDPSAASTLLRSEGCFDELYEVVNSTLVTFLLEWATMPADDSAVIERGKVLSAFHALAKAPDSVEAAFGASESQEMAAIIYQRLLAIAENSLAVMKQSR